MEVSWMCWYKRKITFFKEVTKHSLKGAIITQNEFLILFSRMFHKLQRNRCSWLLLPTKRTVLDWSQLKAIPLALKKLRDKRKRTDQSESMFPAYSLALVGGRLGGWGTETPTFPARSPSWHLSASTFTLLPSRDNASPPARAAGEHRSLWPLANFPGRSPLITLKGCRRKSRSGCCSDMQD